MYAASSLKEEIESLSVNVCLGYAISADFTSIIMGLPCHVLSHGFDINIAVM